MRRDSGDQTPAVVNWCVLLTRPAQTTECCPSCREDKASFCLSRTPGTSLTPSVSYRCLGNHTLKWAGGVCLAGGNEANTGTSAELALGCSSAVKFHLAEVPRVCALPELPCTERVVQYVLIVWALESLFFEAASFQLTHPAHGIAFTGGRHTAEVSTASMHPFSSPFCQCHNALTCKHATSSPSSLRSSARERSYVPGLGVVGVLASEQCATDTAFPACSSMLPDWVGGSY